MKHKPGYGMVAACVLAFLCLCVFTPPVIAEYADRSIIGKIYAKDIPANNAGYRYQLSNLERTLVFSKARENLSASSRYNSQSLITEYLRVAKASTYSGGEDSQYILLINQKGSGSEEYSEEEIIEICETEVEKLMELSILPHMELDFDTLEGELFMVVNAGDPAMNISVWELSTGISGGFGRCQLEVDAQTGRIYDFNISLEEPLVWEEVDTDRIVEDFCSYLGLPEPSRYLENDMLEKTPYFQKYVVELEGDVIMLTIGLDPGNNGFFIRIP